MSLAKKKDQSVGKRLKNKYNKALLPVIALLGVAMSVGTFNTQSASAANPESDFTFTTSGTSVTITNYVGSITDVVIPDTLGGNPVVTIGPSAFKAKGLTSVDIPDTVTSIGMYGFQTNFLTVVDLPDSLTTISAFSFDANQITTIKFNPGLTSIGSTSFTNNSLTTLVIPEGILTVGANSFNNNLLTDVYLPSTLTSIGATAFKLKTLPNSNVTLHGYSSNKAVKTYATNNGYPFVSLTDHTPLTAPNAETDFIFTTTSTSAAISGYRGITSDVWIPDTLGGKPVTNIGTDSFTDKGIRSVKFPDTVTAISNNSFEKNELTSITLPKGLITVGASAFRYNKITTLSFPESTIGLGAYSFADNLLTDVTLLPNILTIPDNTFDGNQVTPANLTIRGYDTPSKVKDYTTTKGFTYVSLGATYVPGPVIPPVLPPATGSTQSHDATIFFTGGDLTLTIPQINPFGRIKLESQPKIISSGFDDVFNVIDSRGTNEGWRLDVSASQFIETTPVGGFSPGTSANILPTGSLSLEPLNAINRVGAGTSILPSSKFSSISLIDNGAITVAGAEIGEGTGEFDLAFANNALSLIIDSTTAKVDRVNYPGVDTPYSSTLTWTLVSAP